MNTDGGFYEFKELEAGNYTLTFNKTGGSDDLGRTGCTSGL